MQSKYVSIKQANKAVAKGANEEEQFTKVDEFTQSTGNTVDNEVDETLEIWSSEAKILKQTPNSVTLDWCAHPQAEVYEIEKYHRRRGWECVLWTATIPATVQNLDDNFAYRLRIKALRRRTDEVAFVPFVISKDFVANTLTVPPSTLQLHRAIKKGQQFLVKHILKCRPSLIEYPGPNGYLPLANAIICDEHCIIDILLMAGASVHVANPQNLRSPLHLAFYYGRLSLSRILLNRKADLEASDVNGMTACHFAIDGNQCEILKFALECGAKTESRDACGWTLLLRAVVMRAKLAILKLLLSHGANIRAVDELGQNCVDLARLYQNDEAGEYFANYLKMKAKRDQNALKT